VLPPDLAPVDWSILVVDVGSGAKLAAQDEDRILWTASVGKLFLLVEIARRAAAGDLDLTERVRWRDDELVADSGLWYRLDQRELSVGDLCLLVGAVSDNLATSVLLRLVGVPAVAVTTRALGYRDSAVLDRVRDDRGPQHQPTLRSGPPPSWRTS
jgi:beta-lactamase class A